MRGESLQSPRTVNSAIPRFRARGEWQLNGLRAQKSSTVFKVGSGPFLLVAVASEGHNAATDLMAVESPKRTSQESC